MSRYYCVLCSIWMFGIYGSGAEGRTGVVDGGGGGGEVK